MTALLSEKSETTQTKSSVGKGKIAPLLAGFAFITGLIPCLLHNMIFCESRIMLATDGKHFLHTVSLLTEYLKQLNSSSELAEKFAGQADLAGHLLFDGPIMSLFYAPLFFVLNKIPTPRDWMILANGQSTFHALSTALVTLFVWRLSKNPLFACMAALVYGLYPPAVLQSGHFMSELPVTTALLLMTYTLTSQRKLALTIGGAAAGLIILCKPALIPAVLLSCLFAALCQQGRKQKLLAGGAITVGVSVILALWSSFCFATTGSVFPTAQRQPMYNVVTGWNLEGDGWAYNPHTPNVDMYTEADGPLPTAASVFMTHPVESMRLMISKVSRLSACPWNDFKGRALGLDENAQLLIHRMILACALFGVSIYAFCHKRYLTNQQRNIIKISALIIVTHLSYLMVECQPRYTFTAMPFVVILAIYGIWQASQLSFQDPLRRLAMIASVASALAASAFLLHAETICHLFDSHSFKEKSHLLARNERVEKIVDLKGVAKPKSPSAVFVMVDGDKNLEKAQIEVNGVELQSHLIPTMDLDARHYSLYDQLREFGPSMRISVSDFRQWRALQLDPSILNWNGENKIVIKNTTKEAIIYGDRKKTRFILSPDYCNYGLLAAAPVAAGAESRFTDPVLTGETKERSYIVSKSEPISQLKDSLRIRLALTVNNESEARFAANTSTNSSPVGPSFTGSRASSKVITKVERKSFDQMLWDNESKDQLHINKVALYAARTVGADIPIQTPSNATHIKLRITGEIKAIRNPGDVGLLCALKGRNGSVQILGKTPRALIASTNWRKFEINDIVPLNSVGGAAEAMELALYPCPWMEGQYGVSRRATDALFKNLTIETSGANLAELSTRRIVY